MNLVAGLELDAYFGPRTGWMLPAESAVLSATPLQATGPIDLGGRGAAVSDDGYYLTAYHVVERGDPIMVLAGDAVHVGGTPATIGGSDVILSQGRIVKHFYPADLALVKFNHRPPSHFVKFNAEPHPGLTVFCAAIDGCFVDENRIGNGPFQAKGAVVEAAAHPGRSDVTRVKTTLAVRGGMSGAPAADPNGNLVGILTTGTMSRLTYRAITSELLQLPERELRLAMQQDRRRQDRDVSH